MFRLCSIPIRRLMMVVVWTAAVPGIAQDRPVRFNRDVRPILTDKCFACHGPDAENVEGDLRLDLPEVATQPGGVITAGDPDTSALVRRIMSTDDDQRMPPPGTHKPLQPAERELLQRWIAQGAEYEPHWAYAPLLPPEVPDGPGQPIDQFIAARLTDQGVKPMAEADRVTLIRRLSLDLTGVPPTTAEVDAFVNDSAQNAYESLVDRLLDSPRYGERMAIYWLDLVRYSDTVGYHGDQDISQSPYRDYVINAFNINMPYDQFVREQLAGDLLPRATLDQQVASGYNRLHQTTEEGGAQDQEYRAIYFADRVRNVSQVFMSATMACAQCHDHKYDPYTTRDFYALGAFFADLDEKGVYGAGGRPPEIRVPSEKLRNQILAVDKQIGDLRASRAAVEQKLLPAPTEWEAHVRTLSAESEQLESASVDDQPLPEEVVEALSVAPSERTEAQARAVESYYLETTKPIIAIVKQITDLQTRRQALEDRAPLTVVSKSVEPRVTRILARGNWMDNTGEIVGPAIPEFLGKLETGGHRPTRLDLANWLCQPDHPLTSRTLVNRLWSLMFGRGICASVDDFGGQGTYPSYPDLLDWLALEFVESGWDVKQLARTMVTSKTYRRSSKPTEPLRQKDPYNDLFARQGRFRVEAEMVRDGVLNVSGLLVEKVGGRSVKPYQPAGYYAQLNFPKRVYVADSDENQYRRGVYTHWQRTFLHPMLKAFDAPSREECTAARSRSNTPLQALTLLNDPTFVEAARVFAARIMREGGTTPAQRLAWAYRAAVSRQPETAVAAELKRVYDRHRAHYRAHQAEAEQLIAMGNAPVATDFDAAELAAWTGVARIIFNLHETIMRY